MYGSALNGPRAQKQSLGPGIGAAEIVRAVSAAKAVSALCRLPKNVAMPARRAHQSRDLAVIEITSA